MIFKFILSLVMVRSLKEKKRAARYYTCPTHQRDTSLCTHSLEIRQNSSGAPTWCNYHLVILCLNFLTSTFSHLSSSIRIPRRKNASSFEAIRESTQFLVFSYDVKCCWDRPCVMDWNKWKSEGAMSGEYGGWGETSHLNFPK